MKYLIITLLGFFALNVNGQEAGKEFDAQTWVAPYDLPVPEGWSVERFLIPIGFAPQIPYRGVEDIRFSPGWGKMASDEYWTYAFLWYLDGAPVISADILAENLKAYYTGLIEVNTGNTNQTGDKPKQVITSMKKVAAGNADSETFSGTVEMPDYMSQSNIILNCKVHLLSCIESNKTVLLFQLSPKPFSHTNWLNLDQLWSGFRCTR